MHQFAAIKITEIRPRTWVLPPKMRAAGMTITTAVITVTVYRPGSSVDSSPQSLLQGSPVILAAPTVIDGVSVGIGQAVTQKITGAGRVPGTLYVMSFDLTMADNSEYAEDVVQPLSTFVPP